MALVLAIAMCVSPASTKDKTLTFKTPPVSIPLKIKDQQATIVASAVITLVAQNRDLNTLNVAVTADLSDLQQNVTALLSSTLDKDEPCGDRIEIQNATLTPLEPAVMSTVQLHYERWGCVKLFGKQQRKRLIGGNATIQMKLTPIIDEEDGSLGLMTELGPVEADGSLGELLRSGTLGKILHEKIQSALLGSLKKGTDLAVALPPAVREYAKIQSAEFKSVGSAGLAIVLDGQVQITNEQLQALAKKLKERV